MVREQAGLGNSYPGWNWLVSWPLRRYKFPVGVEERHWNEIFLSLISDRISCFSCPSLMAQLAWSLEGHCCCSVIKLCPTLCDPMDCSMPGFPVHQQLPELAQTHVHLVSDAIQPSLPSLSFPESGSFLMSWLFASGGQKTGTSAWASVLPMNIQDWFPLRLTGLISL